MLYHVISLFSLSNRNIEPHFQNCIPSDPILHSIFIFFIIKVEDKYPSPKLRALKLLYFLLSDQIFLTSLHSRMALRVPQSNSHPWAISDLKCKNLRTGNRVQREVESRQGRMVGKGKGEGLLGSGML